MTALAVLPASLGAMAVGRIANDGASAPPPVAPAEPETASIASIDEQAAPPRSDDPERSTAALEASCPRPMRLAVPRRHVLVRVVDDHDGRPVAGATVAADLEKHLAHKTAFGDWSAPRLPTNHRRRTLCAVSAAESPP